MAMFQGKMSHLTMELEDRYLGKGPCDWRVNERKMDATWERTMKEGPNLSLVSALEMIRRNFSFQFVRDVQMRDFMCVQQADCNSSSTWILDRLWRASVPHVSDVVPVTMVGHLTLWVQIDAQKGLYFNNGAE